MAAEEAEGAGAVRGGFLLEFAGRCRRRRLVPRPIKRPRRRHWQAAALSLALIAVDFKYSLSPAAVDLGKQNPVRPAKPGA